MCLLASGSKGNCLWVQAGKTRVLVDCGLGPRALRQRASLVGAEVEKLSALLLSHDHSDHVGGVPRLLGDLSPMFASHPLVAERCRFPEGGLFRREVAHAETFEIGALAVTALAVPHDATGTLGFVFEYEGRKMAHVTDLGHVPEALAGALEDVDVLSIESNHDLDMLEAGPYPEFLKRRIRGKAGHLSNVDCAALLARVAKKGRCRHVVLAHLSETNNLPEKALFAARKGLDSGGGGRVGLTASEQRHPSPVFLAA